MDVLLIAIFILSLIMVSVLALAEARDERLNKDRASHRTTKHSWAEVARELDLDLGPFTEEKPSLRGSINEHWVSVFPDDEGTHIEVSYRSGIGAFEVTPAKGANTNTNRFMNTGDQAFDSELALFTRAPEDMSGYLSPARRNALLWLNGGFEIEEITNEKLNVRLQNKLWKPKELVAGIQLVVDVADILQQGEKVFMTPPLTEGKPEENGFAELSDELDELDNESASNLRSA